MPTRDDDPFRKILRELVSGLPGAWGAIFVDWEGEAVELFAAPEAGESGEYEMKLAGAEVGLLLTRMVSAGKDSALGRTESAFVRAASNEFYLHTLDEQYFVLLATRPQRVPALAAARLAAAVGNLRRHL